MNITPQTSQSHTPQANDDELDLAQPNGKENNVAPTGNTTNASETTQNKNDHAQPTPNNPQDPKSTQSTAAKLEQRNLNSDTNAIASQKIDDTKSVEAKPFQYTPPNQVTFNINIDANGDAKMPDYSLSTSNEKRLTTPKTEEQKSAYNNLVTAAKSDPSDSPKLFDATKNFIKSMGLEDQNVSINISNDVGNEKKSEQFSKAFTGIVTTPYKIYSVYSSIDEAKSLVTKTDVLDKKTGKVELGTFDKVKAKIADAISDNAPDSVKKFGKDAAALKDAASNWYQNNPNAKIFLKVANVVYGAYNMTTGTIAMYDAKDREAFAKGAIDTAGGAVATLSSFAQIGAIFGAGGAVAPIVSASAGVVGFALFAAGHAINVASMINDQNNVEKSDRSHEEFSYEAKQAKKAEDYLEEKSDNLPGDIKNMEDKYGVKIGSVYTNNNKADYINSVNSDGNSSHGPESSGSNVAGNDHSPKLDLKLNSDKSQSANRDEENSDNWNNANDETVSKKYGYSHSKLFSESKDVETHKFEAGSPYIQHSVGNGNGANLVLIDEVEITPPKEEKAPAIADTDRKDRTNDGHQMVRSQFNERFNYDTHTEYTPYPRSRQGQSKAGVHADNVFTNTLNYAADAYRKDPENVKLPPAPQSDNPKEWWNFFSDLSKINSNNGKTIHADDLKKVNNLTQEERMDGMKSAVKWTKDNRNIDIAQNNHLAKTETGKFIRDVVKTDLNSSDEGRIREREPNENARTYVSKTIQNLKDRGQVTDAWAQKQLETLKNLSDQDLDSTIRPSVTMAAYEHSLRQGEKHTQSKQIPDNDPNPHAAKPDNFSRTIVTDNSKQTIVDIRNAHHDTEVYSIGDKDVVRLGNGGANVKIHVGGHTDAKKNESFLDLTGDQKVTRIEWGRTPNAGHSAKLHLSNGQSVELNASDKERLERFLRNTQLPA